VAEVPPRLVRRALTVPGTFVLAGGAVLLLPVTLLLGVLHDLAHPGFRGRAVRSVIVVTVFLMIESWAILALGSMWLRAGAGRRIRQPGVQREHYELVHLYLDRCFGLVRRLLGVRVELAGVEPSTLLNRPLLVFCRHAGVGDSLLIVHALMRQFDREPRIVLKDLLQWAPAIDIALNRLPATWISAPAQPPPGPVPPTTREVGTPAGPPAADTTADRAQTSIGELATGLDGNDAMVIFPEGGNFTPHRWTRAVDRLRKEGRRRHARQAELMRNVLPPRPGGVLAALDAAPRRTSSTWPTPGPTT